MVKITINDVKESVLNTKFKVYPFIVKNGRIFILGDIKIDLEKESISIKVNSVELSSGKDDELIDTKINNYCLNREEKIELLKEIFYLYVCNLESIFHDISNWKIAMFKVIEEDYQDKYFVKDHTLLEELLECRKDDFKYCDKKLRCRLIISIRKSIAIINEKKYFTNKFDIQNLNNLSKVEIEAYSNIITRYLEDDDVKINIEYVGDKCIAKYDKDVKYTVSALFPNKDIMDDALKNQ